MSKPIHRPCLEPNCVALTTGTRCTDHERQRQRSRNAARGDRYGADHRALREAWTPNVRAGVVRCARCLLLINPGEEWDLDHLDDVSEHPSHAECNRRARRNAARNGIRGSK